MLCRGAGARGFELTALGASVLVEGKDLFVAMGNDLNMTSDSDVRDAINKITSILNNDW